MKTGGDYVTAFIGGSIATIILTLLACSVAWCSWQAWLFWGWWFIAGLAWVAAGGLFACLHEARR